MANVSLPKLTVPDWARVIPEEEWKTKLFSRLYPNTSTPATDEQLETANSPTREKAEDNKSDSEDKT